MIEVLKMLYGDAVTEESLKRFQEELGKKFVPKSEFNQRGEELKMLREQLAEKETVSAGLEDAEQKNKELWQALNAMKEKYDGELAAAKRREEAMKFQRALDDSLKAARARNLVAVKALLNMDGITLEDGTLKGLTEQLMQLRQEHGYLFEAGEGNLQFVRPAVGHTGVTREEFQNMGYMERLKLKKEQPSLYQSLIQTKTGGNNLWQRI